LVCSQKFWAKAAVFADRQKTKSGKRNLPPLRRIVFLYIIISGITSAVVLKMKLSGSTTRSQAISQNKKI
jgi:hypothetical protein